VGWRVLSGGSATSDMIGKDVSGLRLRDMEGNTRTVGELRGRVVLLDFWATWCPPCRMSLPELAALQNAQGTAYAVIPVSIDKGGFGDVRPFFEQNPGLSLFAAVPADPGRLGKDVGEIQGIPTTLIVDRSGKVVKAWAGFAPGKLQQELKAELEREGH